MANDQDKNIQDGAYQGNLESDEDSGFEVSNQGQNIGGGKDRSAGNRNPANYQDQLGGDEDSFRKTDQTISQAAPGQTMTNTTQGGSDA
jgi:hypothetical protein